MGKKYPFSISKLSKGAQKARTRMQAQYGKQEGERIWLEQARERGTGNTDRERLNSIYKKGGSKN